MRAAACKAPADQLRNWHQRPRSERPGDAGRGQRPQHDVAGSARFFATNETIFTTADIPLPGYPKVVLSPIVLGKSLPSNLPPSLNIPWTPVLHEHPLAVGVPTGLTHGLNLSNNSALFG